MASSAGTVRFARSDTVGSESVQLPSAALRRGVTRSRSRQGLASTPGGGSTTRSDFSRGVSATHKSPRLLTLQRIDHVLRQEQRGGAGWWINSTEANVLFGIAIVLHSLVVGWEVEASLEAEQQGRQLRDEGTVWIVMIMCQCMLNAAFTVELVLRVQEGGCDYFSSFSGIFDVFLVSFSWMDICVALYGLENPLLTAASTFVRLLRVVRIFRLLRLLPELRLLVSALLATFRSASWAVLMIALLAYASALICTDAFAGSSNEDIRFLFGSVGSSMVTHAKLVFVEAWPDLAEPMLEENRLWAVYVMAFIILTNMALMNVVTGVICEQVMELARKNMPDHSKTVEGLQLWRSRVWELFCDFDQDNSGALSTEECCGLMRSDKMREVMLEMGVSLPLEREHMLTILDETSSGKVCSEEGDQR